MLSLDPLTTPFPVLLPRNERLKEEIPLAESHSREETGETSVAVAAVSRKPSGATEEPRDTRQESQEVNGDQPRQTLEPLGTESDPSVAANEVKAEATAQPDSSAIQHTSVSGENSLVQDSKVDSAVIESVAQASAASAKEAIQPQVDALWDAVKWMEDRMEAIDAERRGELEEASRTAAQNTAKVKTTSSDPAVVFMSRRVHGNCRFLLVALRS